MELALGIFKKTRFLFALIAAGAAGVAIVTNNNTAYVICIIFIALTIASDATVMAVSYTHLDVYKRQVKNCPVNLTCCYIAVL